MSDIFGRNVTHDVVSIIDDGDASESLIVHQGKGFGKSRIGAVSRISGDD